MFNSEKDVDRAFNCLLLRSSLRAFSLCVPFIIIANVYDWSICTFLISAITFLPLFIPSEIFIMIFEFIYNVILRPTLYIWALVLTVQGEKDFIAISFYIITGLQVFNILKWLYYYLVMLISVITKG